MDIEDAMERAYDGQATLFVGAGFSRKAINLRGTELKTSDELASHFAHKVDLPAEIGLEDAAEEYLTKFGSDDLVAELHQEYTVKEVTDNQLILAQVPWRRIYTTNYDNVIERAYAVNSRRISPVVISDDVRQFPKNETLSVHLNGYIERLNRQTLESQLKLTDASYITSSVADSEWATLLRHDLRFSKAVFFVGFSIADLDIARILFESDGLKDKTFFVVGPNPKLRTKRRTQRFGTTLKIGLADLAAMFANKSARYEVPEAPKLLEICVEEYVEPPSKEPVTDDDVYKLLAFGSFSTSKSWASAQQQTKYILNRQTIEYALERLRTDQVVVIHSDLANGKTLFLEGLKIQALTAGYRVFNVVDRSEEVFDELEAVFGLDGSVLLVLDDYPGVFDVLRFFSLHAPSRARLVLTARSLSHDVLIDDLLEIFDLDAITEVRVDKLTDAEIDWVRTLLDEFGLWGERAAFSLARKNRLLKQACKREFQAILLMIINAPQIRERLEEVITAMKSKKPHYKLFLTVLILSVWNHRPDLSKLADFWGVKAINDREFRQNTSVGQFVDFTHEDILLKSSVVAQYILRELSDSASIAEVLKNLFKISDGLARTSREHRTLTVSFMRFGNLQLVFPEKGRRPAIIGYYESIKGLRSCQGNPLFWLQYGIACLVLNDFARADKYFETAYALAKDRGWDTFQIDNHYARYLLVEIIDSGESWRAMSSFRRARRIINAQVKNSRKHYPYRVARYYEGFYDVFEGKLDAENLEEVVRAARYLLGRIEQLPEIRQGQRYVKECRESLEFLVERHKDKITAETGP